MIECPKCKSPIPSEHARSYRTGQGRIWKTKAWCEGCDMVITARQRSADAPPEISVECGFFRNLAEGKAVRAFARSLPLKPEIRRKMEAS